MKDFSPVNLLLVTGISFLLFTAGMLFLDGNVNYFLLNTGAVSLGLGCFFYLAIAIFRSRQKKNSTGISTDRE
ncbi:MAG: hypothetical protein IPQ08_00505 [Chitinophagaceae bacterium]|nr:hypothetical protein [Chitinophagaceae bacterium]